MRALLPVVVAAQLSCVFDTSGLLPPSKDRPAVPREAAGQVDGTRDGPSSLEPRDLQPDVPVDGAKERDDQPRPDLGKGDLPKPDLPKPDQKKVDLPKPDLPKPDLKKPDLAKPDLKPPPSCASLFGSYQLCDETSTSCRIYFSTSPSKSCRTICGTHACLKAEDNDTSNHCAPEQPMACGSGPCTCDSTLGDGICTCSKQ